MIKTVNRDNSSIIYYIDEDKKMVSCKMYGRIQASNFIINKLRNNIFAHENMNDNSYYNIVYCACNKTMKYYYSGKAKCKDGDMFDENVGMVIARTRMLEKYYKDLYFTVQTLMNEFSKVKECSANILYECYDKACFYQTEAEMINNAETN